jgi:hypothetical protein
MVRNRAALALAILGFVIIAAQSNLGRVHDALYPTPSPAPLRTPRSAPNVPVIWRDFHPGERQTGPATTVRVCASALDRGPAKSALVIRFCDAIPATPGRRFALGYDDLVIRARLPGGAVLAYDLLSYQPSGDSATGISETPLPENTITVDDIRVDDATDLVFVLSAELPLGLPVIDVSGRYAGQDFHEEIAFAPLGPDLEQTETARVAAAPEWARARY